MRNTLKDLRKAWYVLIVAWMVGSGCSREPVDPQAMAFVQRMRAAYAQDQLAAAVAMADSAERYAPGLPDVNYVRGQIYNRLRRYDEAAVAFDAVLERDARYPGAWYQLGHTAFLQQRYRDALDAYENERRLVESTRSDADTAGAAAPEGLPTITAQIGRTYEMLGVPDSARIAYEQALDADSTLAVAHGWLSELYEQQGRIDEALHHAKRALQGDPSNLEYGYQVGSLLFQIGEAESAVPYLAGVAQRWPGHEGATYNLGRALQVLGYHKQGQVYLDRVEDLQRLQEEALMAERGVATYPEDPERWITLANLMLQIGYTDKAEEAFKAALLLKPDDLSLQNDMANLAFALGDTATALQRFRHLLSQDSTFADGWLNLGTLYALSGRKDAAREAWQTVLRLNPEDSTARAYLVRLDTPEAESPR